MTPTYRRILVVNEQRRLRRYRTCVGKPLTVLALVSLCSCIQPDLFQEFSYQTPVCVEECRSVLNANRAFYDELDNRVLTGALVGAAGGAAVGALISGDRKLRGVLIGAAAGALVGAVTGASVAYLERKREQASSEQEIVRSIVEDAKYTSRNATQLISQGNSVLPDYERSIRDLNRLERQGVISSTEAEEGRERLRRQLEALKSAWRDSKQVVLTSSEIFGEALQNTEASAAARAARRVAALGNRTVLGFDELLASAARVASDIPEKKAVSVGSGEQSGPRRVRGAQTYAPGRTPPGVRPPRP